MTQSDEIADKEVREGSPAPTAQDGINAQARAHARAILAPPTSISLQAITDSAQALRRTFASAATYMDRPGTLVDAQPPTFRQARQEHHRCAAHFNALLFAWPRLAWGYAHIIAIKAPLYFAEMVSFSPVWLAAGGGQLPALVDCQPPTFRQARAQCRKGAARLMPGLPRWLLYGWCYLHLLTVKPALNVTEWVTESPLRAAVAIVIYYVLRHWG
jgi:hypothetical protein